MFGVYVEISAVDMHYIHYPKYDDDVCSKLFLSGAEKLQSRCP